MAIRTYRDGKGRTRYAVEFQQKGQRILRRCPPGIGRPEAQALETKIRGEIFACVDLGKQPEISLDEAILRWVRDTQPHKKDQKKPAQNALLLARFTQGKTLRQVTDAAREAVATWSIGAPTAVSRSTARTHGLAAATINRRLCVLKAAAKYAWKQGWTEDNLSGRITLLPEHNKKEIYLTAAEVRRLAMHAPSPPCKAAIMIAAYSGLRSSELLALSAYPTSAATLMVPTSKNGKPRHVPIVSLLRPFLPALPLELSYSTLRKQFCVARAKAGLPKTVTLHTLRHSCASMLINVGVPLEVVGQILGHSSMATTQRYAHLSQQTLKKAMGRLT